MKKSIQFGLGVLFGVLALVSIAAVTTGPNNTGTNIINSTIVNGGGSTSSITTSNVFYVDLAGNDSTAVSNNPALPWRSVSNAVAAANLVTGTNPVVVKLGPGCFAIGTNGLWLTNSNIPRRIEGSGQNVTTLTYGSNEHAHGPGIMLWDKLSIANLTVLCPTNVADDITAIGALSDSANSNFVGSATIDHVSMIAGAHGIQVNPVSSSPVYVAASDCYFSSPNAPAQILGNGNVTLRIQNFYAEAIGPEPNSKDFSCGFQNFGGNLILQNGVLRVDAAGAGYAYGVTSELTGSSLTAGATNFIDGVIFSVTNGSVAADIHATDPTVKFIVANCRTYDGSTIKLSLSGGAQFAGVQLGITDGEAILRLDPIAGAGNIFFTNYDNASGTVAINGYEGDVRILNVGGSIITAFKPDGSLIHYGDLVAPRHYAGADNTSPVWSSGSGSPEGVLAAPVGSLYSRTDGGTNTTLYVKQSGTGNTGWAAK